MGACLALCATQKISSHTAGISGLEKSVLFFLILNVYIVHIYFIVEVFGLFRSDQKCATGTLVKLVLLHVDLPKFTVSRNLSMRTYSCDLYLMGRSLKAALSWNFLSCDFALQKVSDPPLFQFTSFLNHYPLNSSIKSWEISQLFFLPNKKP